MIKRLLSLLLLPVLLLAQAPKVVVTTRQALGVQLSKEQGDKNFTDLQHAVNASQQAWGQKETATTGLTYGYYGGPAFDGTNWVSVGDGTVALMASATNYVERTKGGTVSSNTTGWTYGKLPMARVVTGSSTITSVQDFRAASSVAALSFLSPLSGAVPTTQQEINERVRNLSDWMTEAQRADVAAGTLAVDCSSAFQAAINWGNSVSAYLAGGAEVIASRGKFKVATRVDWPTTLQNFTLGGAGKGATVLYNTITGTTSADPCFNLLAYGNRNVLKNLTIEGNGVVGSGGNGHAIALIETRGGAGSSVWANNQMLIENVSVDGHLGFGKDAAGAAMPSCGLYAYATLDLTVRRCAFYTCKVGTWVEKSEKSNFYDLVSDQCTNNCVYLKNCVNGITFYGAVLNASGSGGATDGIVYLHTCESIAFFGGRWKNGNPYVLNSIGQINEGIVVNGVAISQLDPASGHTAVKVGTGTCGFKLRDCRFSFVNTMTDAVAVDVVQDLSGLAMTGLEVEGCRFQIGDGGTMLAGIRTNMTSNALRAPKFSGNIFGKNGNHGTATTYTDCIVIGGYVYGAVAQNNTFSATTNCTITNCIRITSTNSTGTVLLSNAYDGFGTITNKINAAGMKFVAIDPAYEDGTIRSTGHTLRGSKANNGSTTTFTIPNGYPYSYIQTTAATMTITLPPAASTLDGYEQTVVLSQNCTVTWSSAGATTGTLPTALTTNNPVRMIYNHTNTEWLIR